MIYVRPVKLSKFGIGFAFLGLQGGRVLLFTGGPNPRRIVTYSRRGGTKSDLKFIMLEMPKNMNIKRNLFVQPEVMVRTPAYSSGSKILKRNRWNGNFNDFTPKNPQKSILKPFSGYVGVRSKTMLSYCSVNNPGLSQLTTDWMLMAFWVTCSDVPSNYRRISNLVFTFRLTDFGKIVKQDRKLTKLNFVVLIFGWGPEQQRTFFLKLK